MWIPEATLVREAPDRDERRRALLDKTRASLDAGQPSGTEIQEITSALRPLLDQPAEARHRVPLAGGRAAPANARDISQELLGLGLPAVDQDTQAQALCPPVQGQEMEQAVGVHGHRAVKVDHEVPLTGDVIQRPLELPRPHLRLAPR
ncbi:hypothetical protein [Streptomyces sp. NBC_00273]|uniref:hypothetical protein n=1 Tax=Streptomyces sp. NBC_00273 TaxID=2903644 RepID=UPI002E29BD38|nr:hypothetical protein [Streptomyces sp. NBC_00273]